MAAIALLLGEALPMTCGLLIAVIVVWPHPRVRHHRIRNRIFLWRVRRAQRRSRLTVGSVTTPDSALPQYLSGDGVEPTPAPWRSPTILPLANEGARGSEYPAGAGGLPPTASRVRRASTPVGGVTPASAPPTGLHPRVWIHGA